MNISDSREEGLIFCNGYYPWIALSLSGLYLAGLASLGGLHFLNVLFVLIVLSLYFLSRKTRRFTYLCFPYVIHFILLDGLRFFPRLWPTVWSGTRIHIRDIYVIDHALFGWVWKFLDQIQVWFHLDQRPLFNSLIGIGYLMHSPALLILAVFLFRTCRWQLLQNLTLSFLVMNLLAMATYIVFPVAPPWYVDQYHFSPPLSNIAGNAAGLLAFDQYFHSSFMKQIFTYVPVVFGAMPSMHAGFAMMAMIYGVKAFPRSWFLFLSFVLFISFGAVYSRHHYVVDVLAGYAFAYGAFWLCERWLLPVIYSKKVKQEMALEPAFD